VSLEAFDAMQRESTSARARAEGVLVADPDPGSDLETDPGIPNRGTLRTDARTSEDLVPPAEAQFAGKDFLPAPGLRRVALALIARDNRLRHLDGTHVEYLWKRRGGSTRGQPKTGEAVLPSGLSRHAWNQMAQARTGNAQEQVPFVIWLAADHVSEYTPLQIEATLYRQLLKLWWSARDRNKPALRAPDFQGFTAEILRYGLWNLSLVQAGEAVRQAQPVPENGQAELPLDGEPEPDNDGDNDPWETTSVEIPETTSNGAASG
jgi:hypothetical protein